MREVRSRIRLNHKWARASVRSRAALSLSGAGADLVRAGTQGDEQRPQAREVVVGDREALSEARKLGGVLVGRLLGQARCDVRELPLDAKALGLECQRPCVAARERVLEVVERRCTG